MKWRAGALTGAVIMAATCWGVASCSGAATAQQTGLVRGTYEQVGGPAIIKNGTMETQTVPLSGTVLFTGDGQTVNVTVGKTGTFSARLAVGTYTVTGHSQQDGSCAIPQTTHVQAGKTVQVSLICAVS